MEFKKYHYTAAVIFMISLAVSIFVYISVKDIAKLNESKYFDSSASFYLAEFKNEMRTVENILTDIQAFYGASNYVDASEFKEFLSFLPEDTRKVHFIGFLPKVTPENKEALAQDLENSDVIKWSNIDESAKNFYPVFHGFPKTKKWEELYGQTFPEIEKITSAFLDQNLISLDPFIIPNTQMKDLGASFWSFYPIYKKGNKTKDDHVGFAAILFSIEKLMAGMNVNKETRDDISFHIMQKDSTDTKVLYTEDRAILGQANKHPNKQISLKWLNTEWLICVLPSQGSLTQFKYLEAIIVLLAGLMLSFGIARYVMVSGTREEEAQEGNKRLQDEIFNHMQARKKTDIVTESLRKLAEQHKLFAEVIKGTINGFIIMDAQKSNYPSIYVNDAFSRITGYKKADVLGRSWEFLLGDQPDMEVLSKIDQCLDSQKDLRIDIPCYKQDGTLFHTELTLYPVFDDETLLVKNYVAFFEDITERIQIAEDKLEMERKSSQTRKLESLGTLAAGIAHEINTPVQYVNDNVTFLSKSSESILNVLSDIQEKIKAQKPLSEMEEVMSKADFDFLKGEMPESAKAAHDGISRVKEIVKAVKDFSRPPVVEKTREDINAAVEGALVVTRHSWKTACTIVKNLSDDLPQVHCHSGELNQVLLNLIVNAVDATADNTKENPAKIKITTLADEQNVKIIFEDNGPGVPEEIAAKVFDPFFTTKQSKEGTGQGLAISKMIIEKNHEGTLELDRRNEKTCFIISLPHMLRKDNVVKNINR